MTRSYALGALQVAAIEIYVLDPAHDPIVGLSLAGSRLIVDEAAITTGALVDRLIEAANSAGESDDREVCEALTRLACRVRRHE